jgi:hypothetical protein
MIGLTQKWLTAKVSSGLLEIILVFRHLSDEASDNQEATLSIAYVPAHGSNRTPPE